MKKRDQGGVPPTARSAEAFGALIYIFARNTHVFIQFRAKSVFPAAQYIHRYCCVCCIDLIVYCIM